VAGEFSSQDMYLVKDFIGGLRKRGLQEVLYYFRYGKATGCV
jgi:hypothetical protein